MGFTGIETDAESNCYTNGLVKQAETTTGDLEELAASRRCYYNFNYHYYYYIYIIVIIIVISIVIIIIVIIIIK